MCFRLLSCSLSLSLASNCTMLCVAFAPSLRFSPIVVEFISHLSRGRRRERGANSIKFQAAKLLNLVKKLLR